MARATIQTIAANTAINDVVAITAIYGVLATKSAKRVIPSATIQNYRLRCAYLSTYGYLGFPHKPNWPE